MLYLVATVNHVGQLRRSCDFKAKYGFRQAVIVACLRAADLRLGLLKLRLAQFDDPKPN